jgi:2-polyprenyl-6-methoxyphenol hydroxylase-like FAD-dependent oxidoreductase
MHCWGGAETRALGIYELLKSTCAVENRYFSQQFAGAPPAPERDLLMTTPHQVGSISFHHPEMQEVLIKAAENSGAEIRRGVTVVGVTPGQPASVRVREGESESTHTARLVVGADGRNSRCREWGGFQVNHDPDQMVVAGVLFEGMRASESVTYLTVNPPQGNLTLVVPLGKQRFRSYVAYFKQGVDLKLSGPGAVPKFVETSVASGVPQEWYEGAQAAGPLASFDGADSWVDHPYQNGVVLVGDAAAATDPSFGCGLSLSLRDVRVLRDHLLANDNWDSAAQSYAAAHDEYYGSMHRQLGWMTRLMYDPSANAERQRAFPLIAQDPMRVPDIVGLGPEFPSDETARRRFFGEI